MTRLRLHCLRGPSKKKGSLAGGEADVTVDNGNCPGIKTRVVVVVVGLGSACVGSLPPYLMVVAEMFV